MTGYTLLIGMCSGGTVRSETVTALIGAMDVLKGHGVGVNLRIMVGGYVSMNRNILVRSALEINATHLMFIDADHTFLPSSVQRLLDADKDIVGAPYNARPVPGKPVVSTIKLIDPATDPNGKTGKPIETEYPAQLFKLFAVATGFMLVKTDVFRKMKAPWFVDGEDENGECFTEDVEFCRKAHLSGFDVWCSPSIHVGHLGLAEY